MKLSTVLKPVRSRVTILILGLALCGSAKAGQYSFTYTNASVIPDGNPTGLTDTRTVSGIPSWEQIVNVEVTINIAGGYNGDLYGYLRHEAGSEVGFAVLLNRVGRSSNNPQDGELYFGYPDTGFAVTFSDTASADIHTYRSGSYQTNSFGQLLGTWQPDGRNVNPYTVLSADPRSAFLSSFAGLDPNGEWTLFLADCSSGEEATLQHWGLNILTVPEPGSAALATLAAVGITICLPSVRRRFTTRGHGTFTNSKS